MGLENQGWSSGDLKGSATILTCLIQYVKMEWTREGRFEKHITECMEKR